MGLRRLGDALRRLPAARAPARRVRARRGCRRGAPADRHGGRGGDALPVGRGGRLRRAARARRGRRPAGRRREPQPLPGPGLQARVRHPPRRGDPRAGGRAHDRVRRDRPRAGLRRAVAVAGGRDELPGAGRPACAAPADARVPPARVRGAARGADLPRRVQVLRARLLRHRPGRLGLGAAHVPGARRARGGPGRSRPPRAGHERGADRRAAGGVRDGSAASTSTTASTPTTI